LVTAKATPLATTSARAIAASSSTAFLISSSFPHAPAGAFAHKVTRPRTRRYFAEFFFHALGWIVRNCV
jgi:hypothetical protein